MAKKYSMRVSRAVAILTILLLGGALPHSSLAFSSLATPAKMRVHQPASAWNARSQVSQLHSSPQEDQDQKLSQLGFSDDEIRRRNQQESSVPQDMKVRVDLVEDVDPFTLTAIGFALIAANFLLFANMGDGGISGLIATIINSQ